MTDAAQLYAPLIWLGYTFLSAWLLYSRRRAGTRPPASQLQLEHGLLGFLLLAHVPLAFSPLASVQPHFGAAEALGMLTWLAVLIYWTAAFTIVLEGLQTILLPVAVVTLGLSLLLPAGVAKPELASPMIEAHLGIAMLASGLFAVAAGLAVLMRLADRDLHRPARGLLRQLPPLLALEKLLFSTIGLGFLLLTATLVTGAIFSDETTGKPLNLSHANIHKTVFSIAAWLVFGALLLGRRLRGLRGRVAANWTLAGFSLLFLAYIGSRFVQEVLLHRA
ncbi:MAG: cytochrome c biogenesis protein CcsA [Burkholderiales bacterium]|nr:cytochrome c biogenesis protein CcsA [Burkholderiales bacterium]